MSSEPTPGAIAPAAPAPLQFDAAEPIGGAAGGAAPTVTCAVCSRAIAGEYFQVNSAVTCPGCRDALVSQVDAKGVGAVRVLKAAALGALGGLAGAVVWFLVMAYGNLQIGIVAVLVGWLVGRGVRRGSGNRGGWRYQTVAIAITYLSIGLTYFAVYMKEDMQEKAKPAAVSAAVKRDSVAGAAGDSVAPATAAGATTAQPSRAARAGGASSGSAAPIGFWTAMFGLLAIFAVFPLMMVKEDPLSFVFLAIAIYEAWKINKALHLDIRGPFRVGAPRTAAQVLGA